MASQELLRQGSYIRIGSGHLTKIWGEPWRPELQHEHVCSLRLSETGSWDLDLLKDLFTVRDQQQILSIPLSLRICEDKWIWANDAKGCYTVKSGYKVLMKNSDITVSPSI